LHPIIACLAYLAVLCDLYGSKYNRWGAGTTAFSLLAALVAFVAFVLDEVLFTIVRDEFIKSGLGAIYGLAMWLSFLAFIFLTCAAFHYQPCGTCRGATVSPMLPAERWIDTYSGRWQCMPVR
jgi:hypothetical protein